MKQFIFLVACFLTSGVLAQKPSEKPSDQERWADRIYKWVGDIAVDREALIKDGYVVLMDGILIQPDTSLLEVSDGHLKLNTIDVPDENQFQRLYARKGNDFDYRAFNQISPRPAGSVVAEPQVHHWLEFLNAGAITQGREIPFNETDRRAPAYVDRPEDVSVGEWFVQKFTITRGITPYDSFVIPYSFVLSYGMHPESVEQTLMERYQLQKVTPQLGGLMVSEWTRTMNGGELILKIKHDPNHAWMPTDVSLKSGKGWPETVKVDQHLRLLRWSKIDHYWLPQMIESSHDIGGSGRHVGQLVKLQWAIGKKVSDSTFNPTTDDMRQPILDHFGVEFRRIKDGQMMSTPILDPPADLLEEFQADESR